MSKTLLEKEMRKEQEIFEDLATLCSSPGYIHALAALCFRDNFVRYQKEMKPEDMAHMFSHSRLIRTEMNTLAGLLVKQPIDYTLPEGKIIHEFMEKSDQLLEELHKAMAGAGLRYMFDEDNNVEKDFNPFTSGEVLREGIFYGSESAYSFQYRDFSTLKYATDNAWLEVHKGFNIETAREVVKQVCRIQDEKMGTTLKSLRKLPPEQCTMLPGFTFTAREIAERTGRAEEIVEKCLMAFTLPQAERNAGFGRLGDFNAISATPILRKADEEFVLLNYYNLVEALYEAPFYWMGSDKKYAPAALKNRGDFTEGFALDRLKQVFGDAHVYPNVDIHRKKGEDLGEIDVLVVFADRVIVLQAKSKRLTLEARKGNDLQLQDDFKKAVQHAYDQAYACAEALVSSDYKLTDAQGQEITLPTELKTIYPVCIVADHYPALAFQARQFLTYKTTDQIRPPLVTDVFALDAMTEMLESPLRLLSYLELRALFGEKLMVTHEHTLLSYHLKRNLWIDDKVDMVLLDDDIAADLDIAMAVRRDGIAGTRTPDGILTRFKEGAIGRLISEIEAEPEPMPLDLGLFLLQLGEDTLKTLENGMATIVRQAKADRGTHDITIAVGTASSGLSVHCNNYSRLKAAALLRSHCELRKYSQKASSWYGLVLHPADGKLRFGLKLEYPWHEHGEMEKAVGSLKGTPFPVGSKIAPLRKRKTGRNDPCTCGSGHKYKKCCLK